MKKIKVVMCGSALSNGGGVVAVTKNYLEYYDWDNVEIKYVVTHIYGSALKKILVFISAYLKILGLLIRRQADIFHLHVCDGGPFYRKSIILFTAKLFQKKVVLHHHTDYTEFFGSISGLKAKFVKRALREADLNIVLGQNLIPVIKGYESMAKIQVLYNAVLQKEKYCFNQDADTILFLGWLLERKGIFDLLQAVKLIEQSLPNNIKIALCGFADDMTLMRIREYGLDERISHIGWVDGLEKKKLLGRTIVNVLPSYREGLPMTILETLAMGIPNIASKISTIPEVIKDKENVLMIEPGYINQNSDCIRTVILNEQYRRKLSEYSFDTIKDKFELKKHIDMLNSIYIQLCKGCDND